jgi:Rieske 2Fe-2S family protein
MDTFVKPVVAAGAKTLPAPWYLSSENFLEERERVFGREWICVGRSDRIERPGDFFTTDPAGESLIVTRDRAGAVRAFYNVCRHRGTRLCQLDAGHFQGSIQCPYHAWTYALDGELKVARNMEEVPGFERGDYPLKAAAVALWEGFIFVNLAAKPEPFERALSPLVGRFAAWDLENLRTACTIEYDVACNWKLLFQNYSECYHCPLVHPQLDKLSPSDSGRNDLVEGAVLGGYSELRARGSSLTISGQTSRPPLGSVGGADLDRAYYYTIFPSMLFSLHRDYAMVHYVKPVTASRSAVACAWLFDPQTMSAPDFNPADVVDFWDLTNRQDWHVNELTQLGLKSRAYTPGPYSNAEGLLSAFDRHYLRVMGAR